jgi:CYTH domain-containing protein
MSNEIERKFFLKELPDIAGLQKTHLERHFLYVGEGIELRIQSTGTKHKLQRKISLSEQEREVQEIALSLEEFQRLKLSAQSSIERESYHLADSPKTDIRMYGGRFAGLMRAEFEFSSREESLAFTPPAWVGAEITGTPLARDAELLQLSEEDFQQLLQQL